MEYAKRNLKRLYGSYNVFYQEWCKAGSKKKFLEYLNSEGVMVDAIFDKVNDSNVDIFDILSNMAYDEEVLMKDDRIKKVERSSIFDEYTSSQVSVIEELLNVYRNKNVMELEDIRVLEIRCFNKFGGLVPIINLFGGKDKYLEMISKIKELLYS